MCARGWGQAAHFRRLTALPTITPVESIKAPSSVTAFERLLTFKASDLRGGGTLTWVFCGLWVAVAARRLTGAEDDGPGLGKWWAGAGERVEGQRGARDPALSLSLCLVSGSQTLGVGKWGEDRALPHEIGRVEGLWT